MTILQDVSKQQYGMFNSINCLFLLLTAFYLIQICYIPHLRWVCLHTLGGHQEVDGLWDMSDSSRI